MTGEKYDKAKQDKLNYDPISTLRRDHLTLKGRFKEIDNAAKSSDAQQIYQQLLLELTIFSRMEQDIFYPALRQAGFDAHTLDDRVEHLRLIDDQVNQLRQMDFFQADFHKPFESLRSMVIDHLDDEDREILNYNDNAAPLNMDWADLGVQMARRKDELAREMHAGNVLTPTHS